MTISENREGDSTPFLAPAVPTGNVGSSDPLVEQAREQAFQSAPPSEAQRARIGRLLRTPKHEQQAS